MEKEAESSQYESSIDVEDTAPLNGSRRPISKARKWRESIQDRTTGFIFGVLVALAVFLTLYHFRLSNHDIHLPKMHEGTDEATGKPNSWFNGDCGSSSTEARDRGCRFDRILHAWIPPACVYDEDLQDEEEFIHLEDWPYYSDSQLTAMKPEDAYKGDAEIVYMSWRWHLVHCTYVWKRLHRALLDGRNINSYIANTNHTKHCSAALLLDVGKPAPLARVFRKFPTCG